MEITNNKMYNRGIGIREHCDMNDENHEFSEDKKVVRCRDMAIYGVGGFGREVLTLIQDINKIKNVYNIIGFFDDGHKMGEIINGYPVLGGIGELNRWQLPLSIAISIGTPSIKKNIFNKINNPNIDYPTLIHPSVIIGDTSYVKIGRGCIICAGTIITTNITIGDFVIMNLLCTVGHDVVINDYSAFMPSCNISGEVMIGEGVYCGTGVKIINQLTIDSYTTIGAGAVVANSLPSYCTAVGVPAKIIKTNYPTNSGPTI